MKRLKFFAIAIAFLSLLLPSAPLHAQDAATATAHPVNIYLFWGEGCPHCAKAKPFLENIDTNSEAVKLYKYEVYYNTNSQRLLQKTADRLGIDTSGVPVIIIGDKSFIGYSEALDDSIQARINECLAGGCSDSVADIVGASNPQTTVTEQENVSIATVSEDDTIQLPLFGEIHAKDFSLPLLTIIVGLLDGFNPCAMWVLLFLISVLLGMENRRRMWALGSTFIASSALIYFLFMTAWLNIFLFIGYVAWVKVLIGLISLGVGGYFLYDYCTNKKGVCKVTGGERRQKVFEKMRVMIHERSLWLALIGIALLAFAVNLVEMVCSAGLPAIYTNILSSTGLPVWQYYAYLLLYVLVFMIDDLFVFFAAMLTLKMVGVHQKYARYAHLLGGVVMLVLGILLIFAPQLLMFG